MLLVQKLQSCNPDKFGTTITATAGVPGSQTSKFECDKVADEDGEMFCSQKAVEQAENFLSISFNG